MDGWPVWLASVSRWRSDGKPKLTAQWRRMEITDGVHRLHRLLDGVGDSTRWRLFRMNLTLCMHRALSVEEAAQLPAARACHLAGGPVEVLAESQPGAASTQPCRNPRWSRLSAHVKLPADCGECDTCQARRDTELPLIGDA